MPAHDGESRSAAAGMALPDSLGRALALLALAEIARREADQRERREKEEREREEAEERARKRESELAEALAKYPQLSRPPRPHEPIAESFDFDRFIGVAFWLEPVFLIFVGNWVSDKTIFESGYPWAPMLLAPVLLGVLNGFWPVFKAMPEQERYRTAMQAYDAEIEEADRREAKRAEIRAKFDDQPADRSRDFTPLRLDGCYVADGPDYHYFARFFADGTVMTVTLSGQGDEVAESSARSLMDWLVPSHRSDGASRGSFTQDGNALSFSATSVSGTVNYEGEVRNYANELYLHSHSQINGHRADEVWRFVPV